MVRPLLILCVVASAGCLREPVRKDCAEFPIDKDPENCGDACQIYCEVLIDACPGAVEGADKLTVCRGFCLEINDSGDFGDTTGNTLQCRITAAVAAWDDEAQCANAAFDGGEACTDNRCGEYCEAMAANCPTAYNSRDGCDTSCRVFPRGGNEDRGNSLECRAAAARRASNDKSACEAASLTGGNVCGTHCEAYCDQALAHCAGDPDDPEVPNLYQPRDGMNAREVCLEVCSFMNDAVAFDDYLADGNSVQCRAYHASAPAKTDPKNHCPHASLFNAAHCGPICEAYCGICDQLGDACEARCEDLQMSQPELFSDPSSVQFCVE